MEHPLRAGVYRHYSGIICQVLGVGQHTETKEPLVIYLCLTVKAGYKMRARPLAMFHEQVTVAGELVDRFTYLGDELPELD